MEIVELFNRKISDFSEALLGKNCSSINEHPFTYKGVYATLISLVYFSNSPFIVVWRQANLTKFSPTPSSVNEI